MCSEVLQLLFLPLSPSETINSNVVSGKKTAGISHIVFYAFYQQQICLFFPLLTNSRKLLRALTPSGHLS